MKILIHGATNGSNYGDCLFAHIFYKKLSKYGEVDFLEMPFFGICEYLKKEIPGYVNKNINIRNADVLVYMSGGYFGDTTKSLKEAIKRYFRYFFVAEYFIFKRKQIIICGVGGGPIYNRFLRKKIVRLMNYASYITVRDEETAIYFKNNGVSNEIVVTTDSALEIEKNKVQELDNYIIKKQFPNKSKIFFHVYGDNKNNYELKTKILPALNKFIFENPDKYVVYVGTDNYCKTKIQDLDIYKELRANKVPLQYESTKKMNCILNNMDFVITVKLHVGIVATLFEKSVLSFARHKSKTKRFYKQIGYTDRCILLSQVNENVIYEMINKYIDIPMKIDEEIKRVAEKNFKPFD